MNYVSCIFFLNYIKINDNNMNCGFYTSSLLGFGYLNPYIGILILNTAKLTLLGDDHIGHFVIGILVNNYKNTIYPLSSLQVMKSLYR